MKKSEFLTNWRGGIDHSGEREAFKKAEASSLSSEEKEIINNGGVVLMPKDLMNTKVFLTDEKNKKMTVIVHNSTLDELKQQLELVGYSRFRKSIRL